MVNTLRQLQGTLWRTAAVIALSTVGACNLERPREQPVLSMKREKVVPSAKDSATIREAEIALRHFLDASREGSPTRDSLAALTNCGDQSGESYFPTTILAGYSVLPSDIRGDTVIGHASVVTVAEQDVDRRNSGFSARQRIREDVLEWDVIPTEDGQHWVVCNGIRFGYFGADSLTTWRPDGASYTTARALVDSIVKARGN